MSRRLCNVRSPLATWRSSPTTNAWRPSRWPASNRTTPTRVICGVRVEEIENPLTQQVRYLDKLVDELGKGKAMEKILRS